jgi:hypothetical protein
MSLDHFTLHRLRLTLIAEDPLHLPAYKGTTLRGGFGITFRRLVCYQPQMPTCEECLLRYTCPYPRLFDPFPPPDAEVLSNLKDITLPLVIEPPLSHKREYAPGDELVFHIVLVGEAINYLSYLALSFQELGRKGLGSSRGRFKLACLEALHPFTGETATIYEAQQPGVIRSVPLPITYAQCAERAASLKQNLVHLRFLTPARLKDKGKLVHSNNPDFHVIWRTLMRRVSSLSYFYCGARWETDYRQLAKASREVTLDDSNARWHARKRYSSRQEQRIPISGVIGELTYTGDLQPFLPVLVLGQFLHVGKGTVFGNGRYEIAFPKDETENRKSI